MALPRDPSLPTTQQPPRPVSNSGSPAGTTAPRTAPVASRSAAPAKKATAKPTTSSAAKWTVGGNLTTVHVGGLSFTVAQQSASKFVGFINALIAAGYHPKVVQGYNDRKIAGSNTVSNHAYGAAIDIDPGANPRYGSASGGKFALPPNVGDIAARFGLNWGGNYKNSKDYMHFEDATAPASSGGSATKTTASTGGASYPTSQQVYDNVAGQYGYLAAFLNDKELGPILQRAAREGWDSDRLQGAIYKTHWYQNHAATTREFDAQSKLDPATQRRDIQRRVVDIQTQARHSGITLDGSTLAKLATQSLRFGWSDQELTNAIVAQGKMDITGKTPGGASATAAQLKEQAAQYMVPVSDGQLMKWVKDIETGNLAVGDFTGYLREQAKSLFPGLSAAIDRGVTVEQYADPYRQQAAQILEVDPQSIDFMKDPKYRPALFQIDPKTKDRTSMSLADWDTYLRKTPDYAKTHQANQQAAAFGNTLLQTFGAIST